MQKQIDEKDALESATRAAQAKEGGESGDYWRAETNRRLGVDVGPDGQPIQTAAAKDKVELEGLQKDLELGDNNQASAKIFALYEKSQRDIQELSVMAMQAQAHRYKKDLNSVFDKYLLPGKSRTPHAQSYDNEFNGYLKNLEAAEAERAKAEKQHAEAKTPEERDAALQAYSAAEKKRNDTYSAFLKTVSSAQFARDISKIQNRIGKVEFARTTSIVLASAAAGGIVGQGARMAAGAVASRIVGTVNAGRIATAGAFLAETSTFTATERALSNAPHGTLTHDLLTNFAMFGAMKGAGKWYEHSFKAAKESSPIFYRSGQIGSEIVAAQTTNEAAFRVDNGRFMDGNERLQSLAIAGVMVPGVHAGAWGAKKMGGRASTSLRSRIEATKSIPFQGPAEEAKGGTEANATGSKPIVNTPNEPVQHKSAIAAEAAESPQATLSTVEKQPIDAATNEVRRFKFVDLQEMDRSFIGEETGSVWGTKVKYLNGNERLQYQLQLKNGKLYDAKGNLFDTSNAHSAFGGKGNAIFVMDGSGNIFASTVHSVGKFHHSSFLAGQPVASAGEIIAHQGVINSITRRSGHYRPTADQLNQFITRLEESGVNLSGVSIGDGFNAYTR